MDRPHPPQPEDLRAPVQLAPHGAGLRARLLLAAGLLIALPARGAECPPVGWPPGLDLGGAAVVEGTIRRDGGHIVAEDWVGPPELVQAVLPTLGGCAVGPDAERVRWEFPEPPVNVAGVVRERGTRAPVEVTLVLGERTARTDAEGRFALRNVAPGEAALRVVEPEWRLQPALRVEVPGEARIEVSVWVSRDRLGTNELVATYDADGDPAGVVRTLSIERARAIPGSLGDPLRALTNELGVGRSPLESGWVLVRGADFDEVGLYLDGVRTPLVWHLGGFTSVVHPEMLREIRFWPGLFPGRYGSSLSGAVDLEPRPVGDQARVVAGANLVFAHAFTEVPLPFGGIAVAARRSYLDGILAAVLSPEAAQIAPAFWDASVRVSVGRGSFTTIAAWDNIDAPSFTTGGTLPIDQRMAQAQAEIPLGRHVTVQPWLAWWRRSLSGFSTVELTVDDERDEELYPGLRIEADGDGIHGGVEVQRRSFRLDRLGQSASATVWSVEPYGGLATAGPARLWGEFRGTALAVTDDPRQPFRTAISPRAGITWTPAPGRTVRAEFGRLWSTPPPSLWLAAEDGIYLPLERSDQASIGAAGQEGPISASVDLFARRGDDLAELEQDASIDRGSSRAFGLEAQLQVVRGGFEGRVAYQLTRSQRREDLTDDWSPSVFETPHQLRLIAIQQLPRAVTLSGRLRMQSGYPRIEDGTGQLAPVEAYDLLNQRSGTLLLAPDDPRLPAFHGLDLRVGRRWSFRRWQLEGSLEVQNVYSRRVVEPVISGFGDAPPTWGYGLPVLPIFGLDGRWYARPDP